MAKRKMSRSKRRKRARRSGMARWGKLLLALGVLAVVIIGGYGVYLSKTVRVKFEGQRWALPARVYARPLELYSGSTVSREQLVYELETLG